MILHRGVQNKPNRPKSYMTQSEQNKKKLCIYIKSNWKDINARIKFLKMTQLKILYLKSIQTLECTPLIL